MFWQARGLPILCCFLLDHHFVQEGVLGWGHFREHLRRHPIGTLLEYVWNSLFSKAWQTYRRRSSVRSAGLRILIAFHALQSPHSTTRRARGGVIVAPGMDRWSAQGVQFDGEAGAQTSTSGVGRARQDTPSSSSSSFSSPCQIAPVHAQALGALALPAVEDAWGSGDADRHLVILRLQRLGWLWLIQRPQRLCWGAGVVVVVQRGGSWAFRKGRRHVPRAAKIGKTKHAGRWGLREQRD